MYQDAGEALTFGDLVEAPWLFDVYVRSDSRALGKTTLPSGRVREVFVLRPEPPDRDGVVGAQASLNPDNVLIGADWNRTAVALTDECELDTLSGNRGAEARTWRPSGRVLFAAVRRASREEVAERAADEPGELGLHPLPADDKRGFPGGLVDFNRLFAVGSRTLFGDSRATDIRIIASLDPDARAALLGRWAGHALRIGPQAARHSAKKFSQLMTAAGDKVELARLRAAREWGDEQKAQAAAAVASALGEAWILGGSIMNYIDSATEDAEPADESVALVKNSLQALRELTDRAIQALDAAV